MALWDELIGKTIVAFRGLKGFSTNKQLDYILFNDGETYLSLEKQCPYDYHDYAASARILNLHKDAKTWQKMHDKVGYVEPTKLGHDPF